MITWGDVCGVEGHAHIGVTATVYAHVRLRLQRDAIDLLAHALREPAEANAARRQRRPSAVCSTRPLTLPSIIAFRHLCDPVGTLPTGPQICSCIQERCAIRFSGYGRISLTTPHCNLPSGHTGHSLPRPDGPPSLILLIRQDSQFRAAFEFDHEITGSSHLSLSNHVTD